MGAVALAIVVGLALWVGSGDIGPADSGVFSDGADGKPARRVGDANKVQPKPLKGTVRGQADRAGGVAPREADPAAAGGKATASPRPRRKLQIPPVSNQR